MLGEEGEENLGFREVSPSLLWEQDGASFLERFNRKQALIPLVGKRVKRSIYFCPSFRHCGEITHWLRRAGRGGRGCGACPRLAVHPPHPSVCPYGPEVLLPWHEQRTCLELHPQTCPIPTPRHCWRWDSAAGVTREGAPDVAQMAQYSPQCPSTATPNAPAMSPNAPVSSLMLQRIPKSSRIPQMLQHPKYSNNSPMLRHPPKYFSIP